MTRFRSVRNLPGKLYEYVEKCIHKFPRTCFGIYLGCVTLLALAGYAAILLFPALFLTGVVGVYQAFTVSNDVAWQSASLWFMISIISGLASYRYIQYKPSPPSGLTLAEDKAPELFKLVQQTSLHFRRPRIHRIVITPEYELDIVKAPLWALPVWSQNTLVIGLPVLQCLSPYQFECMVARRLGQYSKRDNKFMNWLCQLRSIWQRYRTSLDNQKGYGIEPLSWFFAVYAPLYSSASVYAARRDELNADFYAMDLFHDEEVREMITADAVCQHYLRTRYWPAINKIAALQTKTIPTPHNKMTAAVNANLAGKKLEQLIDDTSKARPERTDPVPPLQVRIENIGHETARMEDLVGTTAAVHFLGASMIGIITLIDKLWLKTLLEERKKQHPHSHKPVVTSEVTSA